MLPVAGNGPRTVCSYASLHHRSLARGLGENALEGHGRFRVPPSLPRTSTAAASTLAWFVRDGYAADLGVTALAGAQYLFQQRLAFDDREPAVRIDG